MIGVQIAKASMGNEEMVDFKKQNEGCTDHPAGADVPWDSVGFDPTGEFLYRFGQESDIFCRDAQTISQIRLFLHKVTYESYWPPSNKTKISFPASTAMTGVLFRMLDSVSLAISMVARLVPLRSAFLTVGGAVVPHGPTT